VAAGGEQSEEFHRGFRQGLKETGFVEGENLQIIYRYADNQVDRLPELAADLVRRQVALIFASGGFPPTIAAKQATASIPVVFTIAENPVARGLVASLARPGGNLTGVNFLSGELTAKRLELQHELVPKITRVALLINPHGSVHEVTVRDVQVAAQAMGLQTAVYQASSSREIDAAFDAIVRERATRQSAIYAGRILKGAKPEDLPVLQSAKVELIINMQAARTLGISVPQSLQVSADELIE
jgi:putative ABC transport system substrate-binding protein